MTAANGETSGTSTETGSSTTSSTATGTETGQQAATGTTTDTGTQTGTQTAASGTTQQSAAGKVEDLPDWAQKIIADTRKEAGDARVAGKAAAEEAQKALTQSIGKALGLVKDDEQTDPAKLTEQLTATQSENKLLKIERAAEKAARKAGADVEALLDSRTFATKLGGLDHAADDFASKLDALVKETVDANPKLKATQAAAASGAEFSGGSGESSTDAGGKSVDDFRKLLKPKS